MSPRSSARSSRLGALLISLAFGTGGYAIPWAQATQVRPASLKECIHAAQTVLIGTVTSAQADRDGGRTFTELTLKNLTVLLGPSDRDSIVIRASGGTYGGVTQLTVGHPVMKVGKRYALALTGTPRSEAEKYFPITYFNQGFFPILRDSVTGELVVHDYSYRPLLRIENGYSVVSEIPSRLGPGSRAARGHSDTLRTAAGEIALILVPPVQNDHPRVNEAQFAEEVRRLLAQR